jgi:ribosome biogenesis GTPase A
MKIQWFPGHMHKARKEISKTLPQVDLIIEILDARIPYSSENPMIAELRGDKPCIKLLSKSDLADPNITREWLEYLAEQKNVSALAVTTEEPQQIRQLPQLIKQRFPDRDFSQKTLHAMIMGIPNAGKSSLINILAGKIIAKTGNEPAVTKSQQQIKLSNGILLHDTPGVLWPNIQDRDSGFRLAVTGAIKDTALEHIDVANYAATYLLQVYPDLLRERYSLELLPETGEGLLAMIGAKRGCLRKGGKVDLDKSAKILLNEIRSGTLGAISLESPSMLLNSSYS